MYYTCFKYNFVLYWVIRIFIAKPFYMQNHHD